MSVSTPVAYAAPVEPDRLSEFLTRLLDRTPRWFGPLLSAGGVGAAAAYTLLVHPTSYWASTHPMCVMRILTGFDCPGCGGTRSAWYLMHGELAEATRHHALFVFAVPFLMYMYVTWMVNTLFGWRVPQLRPSAKSIMIFMVAWGVFSIVRNLPWAPFTSLYV